MATNVIVVVTIYVVDVTIKIVTKTILVCWGYINKTFVEAIISFSLWNIYIYCSNFCIVRLQLGKDFFLFLPSTVLFCSFTAASGWKDFKEIESGPGDVAQNEMIDLFDFW